MSSPDNEAALRAAESIIEDTKLYPVPLSREDMYTATLILRGVVVSAQILGKPANRHTLTARERCARELLSRFERTAESQSSVELNGEDMDFLNDLFGRAVKMGEKVNQKGAFREIFLQTAKLMFPVGINRMSVGEANIDLTKIVGQLLVDLNAGFVQAGGPIRPAFVIGGDV